MVTKRNCPYCKSDETSRSHRRGAIGRYLLRFIGVRPFRCLNCDVRFYAFARLDEGNPVTNSAALVGFGSNRKLCRAVFSGINQQLGPSNEERSARVKQRQTQGHKEQRRDC